MTLDACARCIGLWFDGDELERALDLTTEGKGAAEVEALRADLPRRPSPIERTELSCVRCRVPMTRRQIVPRSGVVVDVCAAHGIWFEGSQWEAFGALVRAGALEVLRRDKALTRPKRPRGWRQTPEGRAWFADHPFRGAPLDRDLSTFCFVFESLWHGRPR